jgi:hypothetical protein
MYDASAQRFHLSQRPREIIYREVRQGEEVRRTTSARVDPNRRNGGPRLPALTLSFRAALQGAPSKSPQTTQRTRVRRPGYRPGPTTTAPCTQHNARRARSVDAGDGGRRWTRRRRQRPTRFSRYSPTSPTSAAHSPSRPPPGPTSAANAPADAAPRPSRGPDRCRRCCHGSLGSFLVAVLPTATHLATCTPAASLGRAPLADVVCSRVGAEGSRPLARARRYWSNRPSSPRAGVGRRPPPIGGGASATGYGSPVCSARAQTRRRSSRCPDLRRLGSPRLCARQVARWSRRTAS